MSTEVDRSASWGRRGLWIGAGSRRPRDRGPRRLRDRPALVGAPDRRPGRRQHHPGNAARSRLRVRVHVPPDHRLRAHPALATHPRDDASSRSSLATPARAPNLMTLSIVVGTRERGPCRRPRPRRRGAGLSRRLPRGRAARGPAARRLRRYLVISRDRAHASARRRGRSATRRWRHPPRPTSAS